MSTNHLFEIPFQIDLERPFGNEREELLKTKICSNDYVACCYIAAQTIAQTFRQLHEIYDDLELATMTCSSSFLGFEKEYFFAGSGYSSIPSRAAYEFSKAMSEHFGFQGKSHAGTH